MQNINKERQHTNEEPQDTDQDMGEVLQGLKIQILDNICRDSALMFNSDIYPRGKALHDDLPDDFLAEFCTFLGTKGRGPTDRPWARLKTWIVEDLKLSYTDNRCFGGV